MTEFKVMNASSVVANVMTKILTKELRQRRKKETGSVKKEGQFYNSRNR
jgi:hypothetical protein